MADSSAPSILVVDDDKNQRGMLAFALRDKGYDVIAVDSGAAALEQAKEKDFDVAICDIMMPAVNGVDTLKQLKLSRPGLRVIMATAYATTALAAASMKGGAHGFIAKPYDLKELFALLDSALASRSP